MCSLFCHTGNKAEEELLKSLLTDSYCHVCEAVLLFKSQRVSHYEVRFTLRPLVIARRCNFINLARSENLINVSNVLRLQGKKHAQKLKAYLQTKKADKLSTDSTGAQVSAHFEIFVFVYIRLQMVSPSMVVIIK